MQRRSFFGLLAGMASMSALPLSRAGAAESANMGALEPYLLLKTDAEWSGRYEQGLYVLENLTAFNSYTYSVATLTEGAKSVSVDLFVTGKSAYSGGGLVLNNYGPDEYYIAVLLQPAGNLALYFSDPLNDLWRITEIPAVGLRDDVLTRLTVTDSDRGIDILTNGNLCGHFSDFRLEDDCGIMASDIGRYYFANYHVS